MRFEIERKGLRVIPETALDQAFIEDTLGLKKSGDAVALVRQDAHGVSEVSDLTTHPFPNRLVKIVARDLEITVSKTVDGVTVQK